MACASTMASWCADALIVVQCWRCSLACAGAYIPAGGSSTIAAAMIPAIEAAGGAVVTSADVAQIVVREGRAVGVKLADGREITSDVVSECCENSVFKACSDGRGHALLMCSCCQLLS